MKPQSVKVRLGCDNCGHDAIYEIPKRRRIVDYKPEDDFDKPTMSHYHPMRDTQEVTYLPCLFCGLCMLKTFWWKDEPSNAPMREEVDGHTDSRNAS